MAALAGHCYRYGAFWNTGTGPVLRVDPVPLAVRLCCPNMIQFQESRRNTPLRLQLDFYLALLLDQQGCRFLRQPHFSPIKTARRVTLLQVARRAVSIRVAGPRLELGTFGL